jgi:hypothetical protein
MESPQLSQRILTEASKLNIRGRYDLSILAFATTVVTLAMLLFGLLGSGGHLAVPLDDTFIHLQYASQLAAGHPFQYNTGDIPSSGESSFLYPFLLAPSFLLGIDGSGAIFYALSLGFIAHLVAILLLYKLAILLFSRPVALVAASFLLLNGRTNWHALTGMETIVYMGALVAFFYALAKEMPNNRYYATIVVGSLAVLLRPEGHMVISAICLLTLFYFWRTKTLSGAALLLLVPILVGLIPYIVNIALTDSWQFNTATGKSSFFVPYLPLFQQLSLIPIHFFDTLKDTYLGLDVPYSPFPLVVTLPVMAIGAGHAISTRLNKPLNILLLFGLIFGTCLALVPRGAHFDRYFQPYDFIVWLYLAAGFIWLIESARRLLGISSNPKAVYAASIGTLFLFLLPQFIRYFFLLGESTRDIYYQQMVFSYWIRDNTATDARIGVNDVGAHKYLSDRYITDLVGLTDNDLRGVFFSGWGSIYDVLTRRPENKRPQYLLIHPDTFINNIGDSVNQDLLTPQYSITVQNIAITAGAVETFYKFNWERASLDQSRTYRLHTDEAYYDAINIGDLLDEKAHKYRMAGREAPVTEPKSILTTSGYDATIANLTESGRRHSGLEQFSVKSIPGRPLALVTRSLLNPETNQRLRVFADGKEVGIWESQNTLASTWQEYDYVIPATFVTGEQTTITIDATFDPGGPGFISYRYWVYVP